MMDPELKQKWVAALRSGEYKQGTGRLRYDHEFCCLGVLAHIIDPVDIRYPSDAVVNDHAQFELTIRNDGIGRFSSCPKSFPEIADWIEANL